MYNQIVEVESNVVKITTGGLEKEYNKTDLKCSATDIMVFLYYYTDSKNQIVASWNAYQADLYGYTLSSLKSYIDGLLSSSKANLSNINLGSVGEFATQADAIAGGLKNGDVYRLPKNADNRMLAIVNAIIESYTAGTSTIDFTNNGGDDWNIDFKITPDTVQSTANIVGYQYNITHWLGGVNTPIDSGFKTNDYSYNAVGNGAGVYQIAQIYVLDDSSSFSIRSLIVVDGSGAVLYSIAYKGTTINSVSGLNVDATANIVQAGVTYSIKWYSFTEFPPTNPLTLLGSGATLNTSIPTDSVGFGFSVDLGTEFTDDFPPPHNAGSTLSITIN